MNTLFLLGAPVAGSAIALLGAGPAAASPDVVGQPYSDAVTAIEEDGGSAHVAVTVGGRLPQDECIVTSAWDARHVRPMTDDVYYELSDPQVMLALNCAGSHATATSPGASVASPMGREAKAAAEDAAAQATEEGELAEVSTPGE